MVAGTAWSIETVGLPPPARADRVAADIARWLHSYRLAVDVFHIEGRRTTGECFRSRFRFPHGSPGTASVVSFTPGPVALVSEHHHAEILSGRREPGLPMRLAARAGCTYELLIQLANVAQAGLHVRVERAFAAGQPALALRLPRLREERLTLFVTPRTYRPLVAFVAVKRREVSARLFLTRVTPGLLARFRLGPGGRPEERR